MASDPFSPLVTISPKEVLRFFDEKPPWSSKQATSIVGIVGEDLGAACFQHYLKSRKASSCVRESPVTTGRQRGPRLDRWIDVDWPDGSRTVFQTEIKNWSAHAVGGKVLPVSATHAEVTDYRQERWEHLWSKNLHTLNRHDTAKVLLRMNPPGDIDKSIIRPLLIFWEAVGPRGEDHLFRMDDLTCNFGFPLPGTWPNPENHPDRWDFNELWVFSVSSYLRSIREARIELNMPNAARRIQILDNLFQAGRP